MAVLDKFKFWKKKDPFADIEKDLGMDSHPTGLDKGYGQHLDDHMMGQHELGLPKQEQKPAFEPFSMDHPEEERRKTTFKPQQFQQQPIQQPVQSAQPQQNIEPQIQLIAAKLDTIKVSLESMNHRLVALERALHVKEQPQPKRRRGVW